ncbi:MAG: SpoIIE family protein phosphatase [Calditrichaeota bacterium]|nr:SpoIIE family protein phosphatase [Calditrichota bacterium]
MQETLHRLGSAGPGDFSSPTDQPSSDSWHEFAALLDELVPASELDRSQRENALLREIGQRLGLDLDTERLSHLIMDTLGELIPYDAAGLYLVQNERINWETLRGYEMQNLQLVRSKLDKGIMGWVGHNRKSVVVEDVRKDPRYFNARASTRSELVVPILLENELLGFFNLESDRLASYDEEARHLLEVFASQVALAVERARLHGDRLENRRVERELELARSIQQDHFPHHDFVATDLEIAGTSLSCEAVGGDYYDHFALDERRQAVVIADVTGKGIPASLIMTSVHAGFRILIAEGKSLPMIAAQLNNYICSVTEPDVFVTMFFGVYERDTQRFRYVNAGHNPPVVRHPDGGVDHLISGGIVLGAFEDIGYEQGSFALRAGDSVLFYTDGLSEAQNDQGQEYGLENVRQSFVTHGGVEPPRTLMGLLNDLQHFVGAGEVGPATGDDLTIMVLRVPPQPS